jgi:ABC-2 type transport system ATP-binding protein
MNTLQLNQVNKAFGKTVALDGLSLEVAPGEVYGLLGPNGAGKTTTVNLAVGLLEPDSGSVLIDREYSPADPRTRARIGVAPQALALYEDLTGEENLSFYGKIQGLSGKDLVERVRWSLGFVSLTDRRTDRVKTYSGGMKKRRLNLAVALVHDPPLLLLDEPTVGVDPQSRNAIFENILELRKSGRAILYTTHYMEEAQRLCDRVGIMDLGKLKAQGSVNDLIGEYGGQTALIAETEEGEIRVETDDPVTELQKIQAKGPVLRFQLDRPNLESVFLNLTGKQLRD